MPARPLFYKRGEDGSHIAVLNLTQIPEDRGCNDIGKTHLWGLCVSTVFLNIDHNFDSSPNSAPILYETMIFDGFHRERFSYQDRYENYGQAMAGHMEAVRFVTKKSIFLKLYFAFVHFISCSKLMHNLYSKAQQHKTKMLLRLLDRAHELLP